MDFRSFVRQVGGVSTAPLVGSDPVPSGQGSKANNCCISSRVEGKSGVTQLQRLAVSYAGPAATLPVTVWVFDEGSQNWVLTATGDITPNALTKFDLLCPVDDSLAGASVDIYVRVGDPGGLANGIYTFLVTPDSSAADVTVAPPGPAANVTVLNFPGNQPVTVTNPVGVLNAADVRINPATEGTLANVQTDTTTISVSVASIDTKTPSLGQALAANSVPSVLPALQETSLRDMSDRAARLVGVVTGAAGAALALDSTLTAGTAKSIARGGAKGATTAADLTGTAQGADHQGLDVQVRDTSGNPMPSMDVASRKGFVAVTDGTNTQAVKAASTAALATDPAAVVSFSPNSPLPAGTALIGSAVQRPASGSADVTTAHNSGTGALVQKEDGVKGAAGNLFSFLAYNSSTSPRWIYVYDALTATGTVIHVLQVPPKDQAAGTFGYGSTDFPYGRRFSTGLSWAASTTPPGTAFNAAGSEIYAEMEYV